MATPAAARKTPRPSKRGRYAKSSETRERILAATLAVAGDVGIHRASVARIAERAEVAVGNVHYHFGSRDDLLRELTRWVQDEVFDEVQAAVAGGQGYLAMEEASLRAYLGFIHRNPAYVRLAEEIRLHQPDLYREGTATWLAFFRAGLALGVERGELPAMDENEIAARAHFLLGARYFLDQMIEGLDGRPYPGDDTIVAAYLAFVGAGIEKGTT